MAFEEQGERIKDLRLILERVASTATIFDEDGVSLRFMNANYQINLLENIRSEQQIGQLMDSVQYKGLTPMGTELRKKVIDGIVLPKIRDRRYTKPHLVIIITDGQPAGEATSTVFDTIKYAAQEVGRQFGSGGIAFQIAQVGNDQKAREFLGKLDEDPVVGKLVDCTSSKLRWSLLGFGETRFQKMLTRMKISKTNPTRCDRRASILPLTFGS
jgi:hypothetical protein